jgi:hypothetical protein
VSFAEPGAVSGVFCIEPDEPLELGDIVVPLDEEPVDELDGVIVLESFFFFFFFSTVSVVVLVVPDAL